MLPSLEKIGVLKITYPVVFLPLFLTADHEIFESKII